MNNKGFTLVEVLAIAVITGCLLAITVPSFIGIFNDVKRKNLSSKITMIEVAANKYGEKRKDDIKAKGSDCEQISVGSLITKGYLVSESDKIPVIYDPTDNKALNNNIYMCYCSKTFEIKSLYALSYSKTTIYHVDDVIRYNKKFYRCIKTFNYNSMNSTQKEAIDNLGSSLSTTYFKEETC